MPAGSATTHKLDVRDRAAWDDALMDCLLLLSPLERTVGYDGKGDFVRAADGRLARRATSDGTPLAYIGGLMLGWKFCVRLAQQSFLWGQRTPPSLALLDDITSILDDVAAWLLGRKKSVAAVSTAAAASSPNATQPLASSRRS